MGLKPSSHPTAPLKLTVPPLKLSMPAESSSPESRRYEVSGLAKPVSPMLRHSISVPEGEVHRQLPGLSRTGEDLPAHWHLVIRALALNLPEHTEKHSAVNVRM